MRALLLGRKTAFLTGDMGVMLADADSKIYQRVFTCMSEAGARATCISRQKNIEVDGSDGWAGRRRERVLANQRPTSMMLWQSGCFGKRSFLQRSEHRDLRLVAGSEISGKGRDLTSIKSCFVLRR